MIEALKVNVSANIDAEGLGGSKTFHSVGTQGFCADANGGESTARRFEPVGCELAEADYPYTERIGSAWFSFGFNQTVIDTEVGLLFQPAADGFHVSRSNGRIACPSG